MISSGLADFRANPISFPIGLLSAPYDHLWDPFGTKLLHKPLPDAWVVDLANDCN